MFYIHNAIIHTPGTWTRVMINPAGRPAGSITLKFSTITVIIYRDIVTVTCICPNVFSYLRKCRSIYYFTLCPTFPYFNVIYSVCKNVFASLYSSS